MNRDRVTREGVEGSQPERDAITGGFGRGGGRGGRRERRMVPDAQPTSYYGRPVLKAPTWKALDIAGYLYLGGVAGGSSVLAAFAQMTGRDHLARRAKVTSVATIGLSAVALVHDLGRPSRFYNMLRVFKPTSPMSVGSWLLAGFGPATGIAALSDLTGRAPRFGTAVTAGAALMGSGVATYTAVLLSDTAVPAWHEGRHQMPIVFAASALSSAAGGSLVLVPASENGPARRLAICASVTEEATLEAMVRSMGALGEPYRQGHAGKLLKAARALTLGGAVLSVFAGRHRTAGIGAGASLLSGAALTRFGIFHAGVASSEDPEATTVPQRQRLSAEAGTAASSFDPS